MARPFTYEDEPMVALIKARLTQTQRAEADGMLVHLQALEDRAAEDEERSAYVMKDANLVRYALKYLMDHEVGFKKAARKGGV